MKITSLIGILFLLFYCTFLYAEEQPQPQATGMQKEWLRAITPGENSEITSKKPELKIEFLEPITLTTLVVILDGTDITRLLSLTEKGFAYKPLIVLPSGAHSLNISATDREGRQLQKNFSFTTRHSSTFEEATLGTDITGIYSSTLRKDSADTTIPYNRVEGIGQIQAKLREGSNELTAEGTPIYVDQDKPLLPGVSPLTQAIKKGVDVRNFILRGEHKGEALRLKAEAGDIQINTTPYTAQGLIRRGGQIILGYKDAEILLFSVRSPALFGLRHGLGIRLNTDEQILGSSFKLSLPGIRTEIKATYLTGKDSSILSYGTSTANGEREGDAASIMLTSGIIEGKLNADFELAGSRFDPDTSDEFGKTDDKAGRFALSGAIDRYTYEAKYEYIGRDFESIGLQGAPKDRKGISLRGGALFTDHSLNMTFTRYNDNVRDDSLMPKTVNYQAMADYNFTHFKNLPIGISIQRSVIDSAKEPPGFDPMKTVADTITGRMSYMQPKWNIGPSVSYTISDDKTVSNADNTSTTYSLPLSLNPIEGLAINTSPTLIQQKDKATGVRQYTYTTSLDIRSEIVKNFIFFDIGGTYSVMKASDDSIDSWNTMFNTRLAYSLKRLFPEYLSPTIALKTDYSRNKDRLSGIGDEKYTIFLVFELLANLRL